MNRNEGNPMLRIEPLDHEAAAVRERLFAFLAPHESYGLFILGNLNTRFPGTHLYAAVEGERWLGVAGYYDGPRSLIPFTLDVAVATALAEQVLAVHPTPEWLLGAAFAAEPALAVLVQRGFTVLNHPRHVFMEAPLGQTLALPRSPHEEHVRLMRPGDGESVARLLRVLRDPTNQASVTLEESARAEANPLRVVLEVDGRIVATAGTNGIGIRAFQILGVVTDPAYRRRGFARAVCTALIRRLHEQGARHSVLFTDVTNLAAQRCYAEIGFAYTGNFTVAKLARQS
jgi:ribosomal protein S18 acetylase RimI-like enzyme